MNHVPEIFAESLSSFVRDCQTFEYQNWDEFSQSWNEPRISWHNSSLGLWIDSGTSSDRPSYTFSVSVIYKTVNIWIPNIWNLNIHTLRCFKWAAVCLEYAVFYSIGRYYRFGFGQAWCSWKVTGRNGWRWDALVVVGREGLGWLPRKRCSFGGLGGMCPRKCLGELWWWSIIRVKFRLVFSLLQLDLTSYLTAPLDHFRLVYYFRISNGLTLWFNCRLCGLELFLVLFGWSQKLAHLGLSIG